MAKQSTSWMWLDGDNVCGLSVNVPSAEIEWHDQVGCGCGADGAYTQSLADYQRRGVPPAYLLPDDVAAELAKLLEALNSSPS